ncbi:putative RNA-directed DNA polymerase, eukaryota, reverse transcriptase zinc-binding domain protein [Tanacetum coccineum]
MPYEKRVDVFIANKRSKGGKRFGFIRFLGIKDANEFVRSLSNIWIGNFHLYVAVTLSQRGNDSVSQPVNRLHAKNENPKTESIPKPEANPNFPYHQSYTTKPLYADVIHNKQKPTTTSHTPDTVRTISLIDNDLITIEDPSTVLLLKLNEADTLSNMYIICKSKGFMDLSIHHVGGLWIWIQFSSPLSCSKFYENVNMKSLYSSVRTPSPSFKVDERMIWIEISGLPLCAWGSNAYKKVASLFGKFKFFEDEESTAMLLGRVCISTRSYKQVSETIKVEVNGEIFDVYVHEIEDEICKQPDEEFIKFSESSDLSRPPGFENTRRSSSNKSKCSTFARHHKKDIKVISLIHELNKIIEVGTTLGYDVRGCKKSLNRMINGIGLIDLPRRGRYFTWMNKAGTKLNKLNRFLISEGIIEDIPDIKIIAIDRMWSDHSPILLHVKKADFGPSSFKFYNSWLNRDGFDDLIKSTWSSMDTSNRNSNIRSHEKLRGLKTAIKKWQAEVRKNDISQKHGTLSEIKDIEKKIDDGSASTSDREKKIKLLQDIDKFDNLEALDLIQKAHIKWDIREKFQAHDSHVVFSPMTPSSTLCPLDSEFLESQISLDEVKNAIWDCGSNKALGSLPQGANSSFFTIIPKISNPISNKDFCPISLIGTYYKIIAKILANRLSKLTNKVVSKEQSAFILGHQILDGPLIISEIIQWYKKRKKKMLIFKVDFEKAFDSVSWKYLDFILHSLNFGSKWRSWIRACLHSFRASIFINGNPTCEFSIKRGLRQGDPLSSFLFILVMEGLQCAMSNAVVHVFYLASGLKINIHKSNIYGIRVSNDEISSLAEVRKNDKSQKRVILSEIKDIEKKIDDGSASTFDREKRITLLQNIDKLDNLEALDLIQKAHIKWDSEVTNLVRRSENVVWDCGSNKSPGPDGFSFAFIKKYLDLMKRDIFKFIKSFFVTGSLPQGANSSFFMLIQKISNPISIKDFRPISLIGTHYKIIAKILANRLSKVIDKVVSKEQFAFILGRQILDGPLIISEIIQWQGDPLSPFLFILVMEGLHCALSNAVSSGLIRGIKLGSSDITLSHLFYADDVVITTDWNSRDIDNIIRVLHVFYLASGLRINIHKSNIYGIGVSNDEISSLASRTGCAAGFFPFTYLGLPIGANMNLTSSWNILIDRFQKRLSSWKANLLSIGGRLTLIKAVLGSLGIYYLSIFKAPESILNTLESLRSRFFWGGSQDSKNMAWVKWSHVLPSFDKGGLNIGSLKAFNLALLQKWRWRMFSSPNTLWVNTIKALHGQDGGLDNQGCNFNGIWSRIVGTSNFLHSKISSLLNSFRFKVDVAPVSFLERHMIGDSPLAYSETTDFTDYIKRQRLLKSSTELSTTIGNWSSRRLIDSKLLPSILLSTSWDNILPRKVNIFLWRLSLDWLPHRLNLSSRDIDIPTISCFSCNDNIGKVGFVRGSIIFCAQPMKKGDLFDNIRASSFSWLSHRGQMSSNWIEWLKNPLLLAGS